MSDAAVRDGDGPGRSPDPRALEAVRRLAGPAAEISGLERLTGGQEAVTWRVDTIKPVSRVVVREYPPGDRGAAREQLVLRTLDGLGGQAPRALGGDLAGRWSGRPTSLISWLDGEADIIPADPGVRADELGRGLARMHGAAVAGLDALPSVFDRETPARLRGPLAPAVSSRWPELTRAEPVLTHGDYWSGNVVWRGGRLTGIVDWPGGARGPRGYDVGWCRLDLVLLDGEAIADRFLAAYESAAGEPLEEAALWDAWALARSHDAVGSWAPNYAPLGRGDLTETELRRRHRGWSERFSRLAPPG